MTDFWAMVSAVHGGEERMVRLARLVAEADTRRSRADYDTGSISLVEASWLAAVVEYISARVVIEIGTFIGTSTFAMASAPSVEKVYTCDVSNDCIESTDIVRTFPKQTSTQMLEQLAPLGARADLCFFDGIVSPRDAKLLQQVTHDRTVYVVHDYCYGPKLRKSVKVVVPWKGIGNIKTLRPTVPRHVLVEPGSTKTLLAALVPEALL